MSFNVSAWSIRNPVPSIVLFVVLMALGWVSFQNLPITKFPNIDIPVITVTVTQVGAAPSELETQVTRKIEDAVTSVAGVKHVQSTITDSTSTVAIEFWLGTNTDRALDDVKDAVTKIRTELPRDIEEPVVARLEIESQSIMTYSATAPGMTLEQLSWHVDNVVKRDLQSLRGVGRVDRIGGVTREIRVAVDPDRLLSLGITAADVNRVLKATTVDLSGGKGEVGNREQAIRTLAGAHTIDELKETKITLPGGRQVRLNEIADITDAYADQTSFARINGSTPIVAFSVFRSKGASDTTVAAAVAAKIKALHDANPEVSYAVVDDGVASTYGNFEAAMQTLVEGAILAVIVVLIFLRDWRATLIAAIALPLSAIPAFWAMSMMGFSLNLVSLLAITLVTGILVDDAIVEIENIVRHMKMGKSPYRASIEAADEIGLAVMAITMTIIAIFAPVSFMGGIVGQYFKQFGLTVAVAVFFSLLVARLITPMMTAYFLRPHAHVEARDGRIMRAYTRFLEMTLARWFSPYLTIVAGFGLLVVTFGLMGLLPQGFIPPEDNARVVISAELPPGGKLENTQAKTDEVVAAIRKIPEVEQVFVIGGTSPTGQLDPRRAAIYVKLTKRETRARHQLAIQDDIARILTAIPDMRAWRVNDNGERDVNLALKSNDPKALALASSRLEGAMRHVPGFNNVAANTGLERPEVRILPRTDDAARYGITTEQISEAVRVATIGDIDANLAKFNAGDRLVPIRVQLTEESRGNLGLIEALSLTTASGGSVPLSAVADVEFGQGPTSIERNDRERQIKIGADLRKGLEIGEALELAMALPEAKNLPKGVVFAPTGDAEVMAEVFSGFAMAMGTGLLMVAGVLVLLLGSPFHAITILLSLPLSLLGVVLALLATHNSISMPVVIGILMLMGIVTKNAIMLVDFAVERVKHGMHRHDAIIDAGRKRARPIVMTTIAMVAGMVPTALGHGDGGEFRAPMAIAVIGGLIVSTLLSLIFVPSFYAVMDDLTRGISFLFGPLVGPKDETPAAGAPAALDGGHGGRGTAAAAE
ncbi:efflux RND transporter permease subunit [Labrys sp. LIt4]|uniref:ABC transporter permease n=1 Tax=Labrys okinawensis TaxID=346911 RepID=A0A2S9QEV8_9HYPH|nr:MULTISPECIES: efflux RND transporter permease subunit [Labrys]MBP0578123.1 efflux RND transporter permease subunit [Labrys sp. LIt4]PRH87887.1 ABC transporter permease [Labrys okinawensis]